MKDDQVGPDAFAGHLLPGEVVVWWGRPQQGLLLTRRDGVQVPFSFVWGGIAMSFEAQALQGDHPFPSALFGVPFILIGLYLFVGRFAFDAWLRSRMFYTLTDRRVLITRNGPWPSFKALNLRGLPETTLNEGAHGRGTILFGTPVGVSDGEGGKQYGSWTPALDPTPRFLGVDDARSVFAIIQQRTQAAYTK